MKAIALIIFTLFVVKAANAQDYIDLLKVNATTTADNTFDSSSTKTKVNELLVDLTVPVKINETTNLLTGVIYETINTKLYDGNSEKQFGSSTLKIGFNKQINEKWSFTGVALPKIASDYKVIGSNDFQIGAIALAKFKKRENLNYKFGLYYNSELFGPFFVPMAGLYFISPNKKFEANIMLPLQADVNYKVTSFIAAGVNFNGQIRTYHLNNLNDSLKSTYVAKSTNEFYAYLKFDVTKNIILQTKVGQSVGRSFRVYESGDKVNFGLPATFIGGNRKQINADFSNGMLLQLALTYRFHLKK